MNTCDEASRMMSERLDGRLAHTDIDTLDAHIQGCAACRVRWQQMRRLQQLFQVADAAIPPPDFTARLMVRLQAREERKAASSGDVRLGWLGLSLGGATLASLLVVAMFIGSRLGGLQEATLLLAAGLTRSTMAVDTVFGALYQVDQMAPLAVVLFGSFWMVLGTLGLAYTLGSIVASYWPEPRNLVRSSISTEEG